MSHIFSVHCCFLLTDLNSGWLLKQSLPVEVVCCHSVGVHFPFCVDVWVFACMLIFWSSMVDGSLAEWLTTGWGALWWRYQPCCVTFSWQSLSWHSETRQNSALLSSFVNYVWSTKKSKRLPLNFYFLECLGKCEMTWMQEAGKLKAFFRKKLRNRWFAATNKGFNWKNAQSVRKGRFSDVLKQNT